MTVFCWMTKWIRKSVCILNACKSKNCKLCHEFIFYLIFVSKMQLTKRQIRPTTTPFYKTSRIYPCENAARTADCCSLMSNKVFHCGGKDFNHWAPLKNPYNPPQFETTTLKFKRLIDMFGRLMKLKVNRMFSILTHHIELVLSRGALNVREADIFIHSLGQLSVFWHWSLGALRFKAVEPKLCCSIFKQTTQKVKKTALTRLLALAPTPPPSKDRVQNPGNPEWARCCTPRRRDLPAPSSYSLSMPSSIRRVSWQH